jgi:hypothetical protein
MPLQTADEHYAGGVVSGRGASAAQGGAHLADEPYIERQP